MSDRGPFLFNQALALVGQNAVVVELGSMRAEHLAKEDGHSTMHWVKSGRQVWTVDTDWTATRLCREKLKRYSNVTIVNMDGVEFLQQFKHPVNLLYLDGPMEAAWNAEAFAATRFAKAPVMLIDDVDFEDGGKGAIVIELALQTGWELLSRGRQALLYKPERW